jgi:hypothetical protein
MRVTFACGHDADVPDAVSVAPMCGCGEKRVQSVKARAPKFTGSCTGPYAQAKALEPIRVSLARPLTITEGRN